MSGVQIRFFLILVLSLALTGCLTGAPRSAAWFSLAEPTAIDAYYDRMATYELCSLWQEKYPGAYLSRDNRREIAQTLVRRDLDEMYCFDPQADQVSIARGEAKEAKAAAERAKREAARAKQEACNAMWDAYHACTSSKSTISAGIAYCRRPICF